VHLRIKEAGGGGKARGAPGAVPAGAVNSLILFQFLAERGLERDRLGWG
jgi:hypothetical protein